MNSTQYQQCFRRDYLFTYGSRLLVVVIGFFIGILSARGLGPSGRGAYAVAVTTTGIIVQFGNFGMSSAVIYFVAKRRQRAERALFLAWISGGSLLVVLAILERMLGHQGFAIEAGRLIALWAPVQLISLLQDNVFLGTQKYTKYNALQIGGRLGGLLAATLALIFHPGDPFFFLAGQLAADSGTVAVGALILLWEGFRPRPFSLRWLSPVAALAARALPLLVLPFLLVRSDILILKFLRNTSEVGVYSVAAQIIDVLLLLPVSVSVVLFPTLAHSSNRSVETLRAARYALALLVLLAVSLVLLGRFAVELVYGSAFSLAYWYLLLLLPGAVAFGLETVVAQYFSIEGFPRFLTLYWSVGLVVDLLGNVVLIPHLGATAAAMTSSMSYTLVATLVIRKFLKTSGATFSTLCAFRS